MGQQESIPAKTEPEPKNSEDVIPDVGVVIPNIKQEVHSDHDEPASMPGTDLSLRRIKQEPPDEAVPAVQHGIAQQAAVTPISIKPEPGEQVPLQMPLPRGNPPKLNIGQLKKLDDSYRPAGITDEEWAEKRLLCEEAYRKHDLSHYLGFNEIERLPIIPSADDVFSSSSEDDDDDDDDEEEEEEAAPPQPPLQPVAPQMNGAVQMDEAQKRNEENRKRALKDMEDERKRAMKRKEDRMEEAKRKEEERRKREEEEDRVRRVRDEEKKRKEEDEQKKKEKEDEEKRVREDERKKKEVDAKMKKQKEEEEREQRRVEERRKDEEKKRDEDRLKATEDIRKEARLALCSLEDDTISTKSDTTSNCNSEGSDGMSNKQRAQRDRRRREQEEKSKRSNSREVFAPPLVNIEKVDKKLKKKLEKEDQALAKKLADEEKRKKEEEIIKKRREDTALREAQNAAEEEERREQRERKRQKREEEKRKREEEEKRKREAKEKQELEDERKRSEEAEKKKKEVETKRKDEERKSRMSIDETPVDRTVKKTLERTSSADSDSPIKKRPKMNDKSAKKHAQPAQKKRRHIIETSSEDESDDEPSTSAAAVSNRTTSTSSTSTPLPPSSSTAKTGVSSSSGVKGVGTPLPPAFPKSTGHKSTSGVNYAGKDARVAFNALPKIPKKTTGVAPPSAPMQHPKCAPPTAQSTPFGEQRKRAAAAAEREKAEKERAAREKAEAAEREREKAASLSASNRRSSEGTERRSTVPQPRSKLKPPPVPLDDTPDKLDSILASMETASMSPSDANVHPCEKRARIDGGCRTGPSNTLSGRAATRVQFAGDHQPASVASPTYSSSSDPPFSPPRSEGAQSRQKQSTVSVPPSTLAPPLPPHTAPTAPRSTEKEKNLMIFDSSVPRPPPPPKPIRRTYSRTASSGSTSDSAAPAAAEPVVSAAATPQQISDVSVEAVMSSPPPDPTPPSATVAPQPAAAAAAPRADWMPSSWAAAPIPPSSAPILSSTAQLGRQPIDPRKRPTTALAAAASPTSAPPPLQQVQPMYDEFTPPLAAPTESASSEAVRVEMKSVQFDGTDPRGERSEVPSAWRDKEREVSEWEKNMRRKRRDTKRDGDGYVLREVDGVEWSEYKRLSSYRRVHWKYIDGKRECHPCVREARIGWRAKEDGEDPDEIPLVFADGDINWGMVVEEEIAAIGGESSHSNALPQDDTLITLNGNVGGSSTRGEAISTVNGVVPGLEDGDRPSKGAVRRKETPEEERRRHEWYDSLRRAYEEREKDPYWIPNEDVLKELIDDEEKVQRELGMEWSKHPAVSASIEREAAASTSSSIEQISSNGLASGTVARSIDGSKSTVEPKRAGDESINAKTDSLSSQKTSSSGIATAPSVKVVGGSSPSFPSSSSPSSFNSSRSTDTNRQQSVALCVSTPPSTSSHIPGLSPVDNSVRTTSHSSIEATQMTSSDLRPSAMEEAAAAAMRAAAESAANAKFRETQQALLRNAALNQQSSMHAPLPYFLAGHIPPPPVPPPNHRYYNCMPAEYSAPPMAYAPPPYYPIPQPPPPFSSMGAVPPPPVGVPTVPMSSNPMGVPTVAVHPPMVVPTVMVVPPTPVPVPPPVFPVGVDTGRQNTEREEGGEGVSAKRARRESVPASEPREERPSTSREGGVKEEEEQPSKDYWRASPSLSGVDDDEGVKVEEPMGERKLRSEPFVRPKEWPETTYDEDYRTICVAKIKGVSIEKLREHFEKFAQLDEIRIKHGFNPIAFIRIRNPTDMVPLMKIEHIVEGGHKFVLTTYLPRIMAGVSR